MPVAHRRSNEPDLLRGVRHRLASEKPLDLLSHVSGIIAALDPRRQSPFSRARDEPPSGPTLDELTESFTEIDTIETSALLAGIAHLAPDELVRA